MKHFLKVFKDKIQENIPAITKINLHVSKCKYAETICGGYQGWVIKLPLRWKMSHWLETSPQQLRQGSECIHSFEESYACSSHHSSIKVIDYRHTSEIVWA